MGYSEHKNTKERSQMQKCFMNQMITDYMQKLGSEEIYMSCIKQTFRSKITLKTKKEQNCNP